MRRFISSDLLLAATFRKTLTYPQKLIHSLRKRTSWKNSSPLVAYKWKSVVFFPSELILETAKDGKEN
uniref:Uncharacterized protein n=1 Tax=Megaselia scalaris TaxID=36166 RepID=T1GM35_MEGSC